MHRPQIALTPSSLKPIERCTPLFLLAIIDLAAGSGVVSRGPCAHHGLPQGNARSAQSLWYGDLPGAKEGGRSRGRSRAARGTPKSTLFLPHVGKLASHPPPAIMAIVHMYGRVHIHIHIHVHTDSTIIRPHVTAHTPTWRRYPYGRYLRIMQASK